LLLCFTMLSSNHIYWDVYCKFNYILVLSDATDHNQTPKSYSKHQATARCQKLLAAQPCCTITLAGQCPLIGHNNNNNNKNNNNINSSSSSSSSNKNNSSSNDNNNNNHSSSNLGQQGQTDRVPRFAARGQPQNLVNSFTHTTRPLGPRVLPP
jgi:hypothetical protein